MDADEREIYYYLKHRRGECVGFPEISRRTGGKRRYRNAPEWARPVLARMTERGILENDAEGSYRLKPMPRKDTAGKRWASPQIAQLLQQGGKEFGNVITFEEEDDYYDKL